MAMGSITMNVAQLAEAVYLGILGTEALAAMGFAFPITITLFAFAGGIGTGASSVIARAAGAGNRERVARLVSHAQLLGLVVGIALAGAGMLFAAEVVALIGARGEVHELTVRYLTVYMLGVPLFVLSIVGSTLLRAIGKAASPGLVMTLGSVLQIVLGPPLIFGWLGLPELGIAGAAWAYVLSRGLSMILYGVLLVRANALRFDTQGILGSWLAIFHVGGPAIASGLIQPVSMLIVTRLLSGHGHEVVAGFNVASRVGTMAQMILWSASSSVEPFVGQNWGAGQYDRVQEALRLVRRFCLGWGVFMFAVLATIGGPLVSLIDPNPVVVEVARTFFYIIPLSLGFMGVMQVSSSCFNALGQPLPALTISLVRTLVVYVPACVLADLWWGYTGIFLATALTNVAVGLGAWFWNQRYVNAAAGALA